MEILRIEIPIPFALRTVNCYFIPGSVPTLIDAGINTPEAFEALRRGLAAYDATPSDIRRIILTHVHSDHAGLTGKLTDLSGARVFVHHWEKDKLSFAETGEALRKNQELFWNFFEMAGVPAKIARETTEFLLNRFRKFLGRQPDPQFLEGGEVFADDDSRLRVVHTPGHTAGSICLFNDREGILVAGDSLLKRISPNPVAELQSPPGSSHYGGLQRYNASLQTLAMLPVTSVLPGHGAAFTGHRRRIERLLHHHRARRQELLEILCAEMGRTRGMTLYTAAGLVFPEASPKEVFLTVSEVLGHLQVLQAQGVVEMVSVNGRRLYRCAGGRRAGGAMP